MEATPQEVEYYRTKEGVVPFAIWLDGIPISAQARVLIRLERVGQGNFGDHKAVGGGVWEMRLNFGPGYRVYYARVGGKMVLLLVGGEKGTQARDIRLAKVYLEDHKAEDQS